MRFQSLDPMVKRQGVVLSQALNISHFKTTQFCRSKAGVERHQVAIGKHVAVREGRSPPVIGGRGGDSMIQEHTAGPQQVPTPCGSIPEAELCRRAQTYRH